MGCSVVASAARSGHPAGHFGNITVSMRRGVSDFEGWCVDNDVDVEFEVLTQLYADPTGAEALARLPPRLRSKARSCVEQACNLRMNEVGSALRRAVVGGCFECIERQQSPPAAGANRGHQTPSMTLCVGCISWSWRRRQMPVVHSVTWAFIHSSRSGSEVVPAMLTMPRHTCPCSHQACALHPQLWGPCPSAIRLADSVPPVAVRPPPPALRGCGSNPGAPRCSGSCEQASICYVRA
jgi:hypothetical protein